MVYPLVGTFHFTVVIIRKTFAYSGDAVTHAVNNEPSIKTFKSRYLKIVSSLNIPSISKA